ncbi:MAG: DEAD/DEAH box helicase family protein [Candidatus Rehaiarchaeum fermentans]|nr:DEAD/DEAH box helicase family protein [Candidatus Rehaiarchaeum fermentans]MCW1293599.1 DEAD/DEAH box helicase family protein [Candidatus Rehaiarchaeum fermentans]
MDEEKIRIIYESISNEIDYETLPSKWQYNIGQFSENKKLYDYQKDALKNAIKFLKHFYSDLYKFPEKNSYKDFEEAKKELYEEAKRKNEDIEELYLYSKNNPIVNDIARYYNYNEERGFKKIHFYNFVNRMGFWMATGSGKTLIIVTLIEILDKLMKSNLIPNNDILILTYRDDLINQIRNHVDEYNSFHNKKIDLYDLKDYDKVKFGSILSNKENINVFIYRSDLISDQTLEKQISYMDIENNGQWYIILDEAHKGNKEDSKRQVYYSFLTRYGFLFNFSATFTDPWDIVTTVYNFNLDKFIEKGYGKNVYLSQKGIHLEKFDNDEKEKVVLKGLILLAACKKAKSELTELSYHNPLMVIYGNSVNTDESDLEIIFRVIEGIAKSSDLKNFENAKNELIEELTQHPRYVFAHEEFQMNNLIKDLTMNDILNSVFNSDNPGTIEVLKIPENNEELVFKLKTSDRPFAMIKIGNIIKWIKEKFKEYEINEAYDNKSYFQEINSENSTINILLGSRSFYEGWDSNRPNVMMFINIGVGDSKKYVLQSIGRGERIEPLKNERKRLRFLARENPKAKELYGKINEIYVSLIETLFVFGTSVENIKSILDAIKFEREKTGQIIKLNKNIEIENNLLLVPTYKIEKNIEISEMPKFSGNYDLIKGYIEWIGNDKLLYAIHNEFIKPSDIIKLKQYIQNEGNFEITDGGNAYLQLIELFDHINITLEEFKDFKEIEDEIVHFEHISAILDDKDLEELKKKINGIAPSIDRRAKEKELKTLLKTGKIDIEQYTNEIKKLSTLMEVDTFTKKNEEIEIKNIDNHYYLPVIISKDAKVDFINHIITFDSEKKFLKDLENYTKNNNINVDYWFFSKIDENLDKIYIPYYNKKYNKFAKFFPDFIFWLKKDEMYYIIFVDPKGTEYTDYEYKVDGFRRIFGENSKPREFDYNGLKVCVKLYLYTDDENKLPEGYKEYWFDNIDKIFNVFKNLNK